MSYKEGVFHDYSADGTNVEINLNVKWLIVMFVCVPSVSMCRHKVCLIMGSSLW